MTRIDHGRHPWPLTRRARALASALVVSAILSLSLATGCGAQEPARSGGAAAVSTPATFFANIQAAKPGDVVVLSEGEYGAYKLYGKKVAEPGIRIEAKPDAKVVFSGLTVENSEGVEFRGVEVAIEGNPYGVNVGSSSRIRLSGLKIHALGKTPSSAMMLRDSENISVADCDIRDVGTGVNFLDSSHIKILDNHFYGIESDAIRGAASYVEVIGNSGSSFHPAEGDHPDFIQFWASKVSETTTGNVIKDNVFQRGTGAVVQGIFIENNENIVITGNAMVGTMYNGIAVSGVKGALIEDNFVQGYADMGSRIITRGSSSDIIVRGNVSESIATVDDGGQPNPRYKEEHNTSIRAAKIGDTTAMAAWIARHKAH
jgi:hypothetical protein